MRLVTWNVLGMRGYPRADGIGLSRQPLPRVIDGIAALLRGLQPDAVALQEAPPAETVAALAAALGWQHAWFSPGTGPLADFPWGFPGAILANGRIAAARDRRADTPHDGRLFHRHWGEADLELAGGRLALTTTHLCCAWGGLDREDERQGEVALLGPARSGAVMAADWNAQPGGATCAALAAAGWRDAWDEGGEGLGTTTVVRADRGGSRIDAFRLGAGLRVARIAVVPQDGIALGDEGWLSDHQPVVLDLR